MKNILTSVFFFVASCAVAQVAIGKASITPINSTTTPNPSISLEFGTYVTNQGKGIILPWITSEMDKSLAVPGTIVYDTVDKIVKYKNGSGAGSWFPLSKNETTIVDGISGFNTTGVVITTLQDQATNNPAAKASIGVPATPAVPGILVLEANNQAMVLPKVASPHLNIINPEPGTMAYDTVTKQLAIYNGKVWSFWKP